MVLSTNLLTKTSWSVNCTVRLHQSLALPPLFPESSFMCPGLIMKFPEMFPGLITYSGGARLIGLRLAPSALTSLPPIGCLKRLALLVALRCVTSLVAASESATVGSETSAARSGVGWCNVSLASRSSPKRIERMFSLT